MYSLVEHLRRLFLWQVWNLLHDMRGWNFKSKSTILGEDEHRKHNWDHAKAKLLFIRLSIEC